MTGVLRTPSLVRMVNMTQNNENNEMKLKNSFLLNMKSRNDKQKKMFTDWINAQSNPQNSFLALINHMVDRFGYADIMDHEVSKKLYREMMYFNNEETVPEPYAAPFDKQQGNSAPIVETRQDKAESFANKGSEKKATMNIDPSAF